MNPSVNIISAFTGVQDENGNDQFTGTIDVTALKKSGMRQIDVVLVPIESVPATLAKLMAQSEISKGGLVMFGGPAASDSNSKSKS